MLNTKTVIATNRYLCEEFGNTHGIRDLNLLESSIAGAQQTVFGEDAYPTIEDKLSFIFASIIKNHCFVDANKRTAVAVLLLELKAEGRPTLSDATCMRVAVSVAENPFDVEQTKIMLFGK